MKATPWAEEKLTARSPVMAMPAVTAAAACSDSGSTKISGLPEMFEMAIGDLLGPIFAHLRGRRDRIGASGIGCLALAHDDGGIAIHRHARAGVLELLVVFLSEHGPSLVLNHSNANLAPQGRKGRKGNCSNKFRRGKP